MNNTDFLKRYVALDLKGARDLTTAIPATVPKLFSGRCVVVKYGGSFMDGDEKKSLAVLLDVLKLQALGAYPVIVHGGGKAISAAMEMAGLKAVFIRGQRVTDFAAAAIVDKVLSREISPKIAMQLESLGGRAVTINGPSILSCRKLAAKDSDGQEVDLGCVGSVTEVNCDPIVSAIHQEQIPIISPTAREVASNEIFNCNADVAAANVAAALVSKFSSGVAALIFMSDVPGVLSDPTNPSTLICNLTQENAQALQSKLVIDKGMIPKVNSAFMALKMGVSSVSMVDGRVPNILLNEAILGEVKGTKLEL